MAAPKSLGLLTLAFVALLALHAAPAQVAALAPGRAQVARHVHDHSAMARRKRSDPASSGSCRPRPSSSPLPSPSPTSAPTPTSSAPTPSATPSAAPAPSGGKWCLAWGDDPQYLGNFVNAFPKVQFAYDWSETKIYDIDQYPQLEFMPMLWGYRNEQQFESTVVPGYAKWILGENEPNEPSQSNLNPSDGYNLWNAAIEPLASQGFNLISPACTNDQAGKDWYTQFMALCVDCHITTMAFHGYTTNAQDVIDYANWLHDTFNRSVIITEFADQDFSGNNNQASMSEIFDFAGQIKTFVEETPWIMGACPFGLLADLNSVQVNPLNSLITPDGQPTDLARVYFG